VKNIAICKMGHDEISNSLVRCYLEKIETSNYDNYSWQKQIN